MTKPIKSGKSRTKPEIAKIKENMPKSLLADMRFSSFANLRLSLPAVLSFLIFTILLMPNMAFAAPVISTSWQTYSILAFLISVSILALIYMISYLLNSNEIRMMAHEEMYQAIATAVMIGLFVSVMTWVNVSLSPALAVADSKSGTVLEAAIEYNTYIINLTQSNYFDPLETYVKKVGKEASRSAYCSFLGSGMNLVICSSMNSIRGPLSMAYNAVAFALADLFAQKLILQIANTTLISVLLPLGIFFRSFKFSRAAGGALIAITIGFYLIFPASVLFGDVLVRTVSSNPSYKYLAAAPPAIIIPNCDPFNPDEDQMKVFFYAVIKNGPFYEPLVFHVIIRCVMMTIMSLIITLTAIRSMAQYFGSEIEVSGLVRLA